MKIFVYIAVGVDFVYFIVSLADPLIVIYMVEIPLMATFGVPISGLTNYFRIIQR